MPLIGGRGEYRVAGGITRRVRRDLEAFAPNLVHVSAPDWLGHRAVCFARRRGLATLASLHTRFETYPRYYGLPLLEPIRSEERRVGKVCVSTCRSRWSPYH